MPREERVSTSQSEAVIDLRAEHQPTKQGGYLRFKAVTELPMTLLALVLGVVLAVPLVFDVSARAERDLDLVGWILWGVFVFEYFALFFLAPRKLQMVRDHPIELILILVPILRPLRFLRILRAFAGVGVAVRSLERMFSRKGFQWFLAFAVGVIFVGSAATFAFERGSPDAQITTISEALWWAVVTCTTVGYGDFAPVTPAGRATAVVLMLLGVSLVSVITANIASFMVEQDGDAESTMLLGRIDDLESKIDQLLAADSTR